MLFILNLVPISEGVVVDISSSPQQEVSLVKIGFEMSPIKNSYISIQHQNQQHKKLLLNQLPILIVLNLKEKTFGKKWLKQK